MVLALGRLEVPELAVIVAGPVDTPVTGTTTVVAFGPNVTVAGTLATPVLLEARLIEKPAAGAATDRVRVRFCVVVPVIDKFGGEKLIVPVTCDVWLAEAKPGADALMVTDPNVMPLICG